MRILLLFLPAILVASRLHAQVLPEKGKAALSLKVQRLLQTAAKDSGQTFIVQTTDVRRAEQVLIQHHKSSAIKGRFAPTGVLVLKMPFREIQTLLEANQLVEFIDIERQAKEESFIEGFDHSANRLNQMRALYPEMNGEGLTVSIKEQRFDTSDIDFRGRMVPSGLESLNTTTHASQMATMIAGGGNSSDFSWGAAWRANITSSSFATLLPDPIAAYANAGVTVQNHSYGTGIENYYAPDARAYDASVMEIPSLLHVFSAGNSGALASADGPYAGVEGFANITGSFKMAKNILVVGATDSLLQIETRSSRGPAYDGRLKPELVAYGHDGSSGSAAIVSGIAAAVQQAYKQHKGTLPDASMTKAILANTAADIGPPGPDYQSGYGSADGVKALRVLDSAWYVSGSIAAGATSTHSIAVPVGCAVLRVMICWSDPAGDVNMPRALINDLDLTVRSQSGVISLPWVLDSRGTQLALPAIRARDSLNNIEQVTISQPEAGNYSIDIIGKNVTASGQAYSICWYYERKNDFEWSFPARYDQLHASSRNLLRWNTDLSGPATVFVRTDSSTEWVQVNNIGGLQARGLEWYPTPGFYKAQLKMSADGKDYLSDWFQVSMPLRWQTVLNCQDTSVISWRRVPGISEYVVFRLAGQYLQPAFRTADTSLSVDKTSGVVYAVAPVISDTTGQRGFSLNLDDQGVGCYANNLLADLQINGDVVVKFQAGTVYNVQEISLQKSKGAAFQVIETVAMPTELSYRWLDRQVGQGLSFYRVAVKLVNGNVLYSSTVEVSNAGQRNLVVFPNPVPAGNELSVLSADIDDALLLIYDVYGRLVLRKDIQRRVEKIRIAGSGIYFYQLHVPGKKTISGKLVVN